MAAITLVQDQTLRIVIVEDEALVALEMADQLSEAGHKVVGMADTADEAIELIEELRPDLALVDVQLASGSTGLSVAEQLRGSNVAVLFATGNCPGVARRDAIGCLHKPYSNHQLLRSVAAVGAILSGAVPSNLPRELHIYE